LNDVVIDVANTDVSNTDATDAANTDVSNTDVSNAAADVRADGKEVRSQGPILQNSISGENFSDKFPLTNFGRISTQKHSIHI
jgi:hypothetical protein